MAHHAYVFNAFIVTYVLTLLYLKQYYVILNCMFNFNSDWFGLTIAEYSIGWTVE